MKHPACRKLRAHHTDRWADVELKVSFWMPDGITERNLGCRGTVQVQPPDISPSLTISHSADEWDVRTRWPFLLLGNQSEVSFLSRAAAMCNEGHSYVCFTLAKASVPNSKVFPDTMYIVQLISSHKNTQNKYDKYFVDIFFLFDSHKYQLDQFWWLKECKKSHCIGVYA